MCYLKTKILYFYSYPGKEWTVNFTQMFDFSLYCLTILIHALLLWVISLFQCVCYGWTRRMQFVCFELCIFVITILNKLFTYALFCISHVINTEMCREGLSFWHKTEINRVSILNHKIKIFLYLKKEIQNTLKAL